MYLCLIIIFISNIEYQQDIRLIEQTVCFLQSNFYMYPRAIQKCLYADAAKSDFWTKLTWKIL